MTRNRARGLGEQTADVGGPEGRARGLWGLALGSDSSWWKQGVLQVLPGGVVGVAPDWFLSRLQDSDGDKSDDLVVDVSNEVSTDRPRLQRAQFGGVEAAPPLAGSCCVPATAPSNVAGSQNRAARHSAGQEEEDRAWLHGGRGC